MADIDDQMEWINEERQKLLKYIDRLKNGNKSDISQHRQTQQRQQQQIPQQRKQQKQQQQQQKVTSNLPVRIQQKGPTITPARHPILAPISSPLPPFSERERHIITPHVELVPTVYENRSRKVNVHPDFELKQSSRKRQKSNINIPVQSNDYDSDFPRLQSNTSISYAGASTSYTENAKTTEMNTFVPRSLPRPLYPIVRTTPKPKSLTKITPLQQGMEVAAYIQNMCSMIRIRMVYKRDVPVKLGHHLPLPLPLPPPRQMARLNQLVTIGDITFTLDSIRPRRNQLLDSNGMEKRKNDQYYESLFYTIWEDEEPSFIASWPMECKKQVASIINQISIQTKLAIDSLGPGEAISEDHHIILDKAIEQTLQLANTYQDNELIWVLYTELALYRYGRSRKLADICTQALQHHHLSIDIHWTMIRSTSDDVKRNLLIIELLKLISSSRKNANFNGTLESVSDATTEILLRCLRKDGLTGILGHLLPASNVKQLYESIAHLPSIRLSMQDIPEHVYLLDHDVCYLWLLIVYHYVFKSLPFDNSRKHWFHRQRQTNTDQPPEDYKNTLFVTDWSVLEKDENKLTGIEQGTVTLIQVEMMKHFCSKTRSNAAKKPLLIAVWRTLMEFLMYQEQYHITGTLLLLKHELTTGLALKPLQPEFIDMIMDLEHKKDIRNSQAWNIITNDHLSLVGSVRQKRDRIPHGLYLAYRWAVLKKLDQQHTHADLLNLAWQLGRPLWYIYNEQTLEKLDSMMMDASTGSDRGLQKVGEIQQINYICGLYSTALGVSDSFGMLLSPLFKKNEFSELGMAWCVAVLVHYIHSLMTLDQQLLNSFLDSTMNLGFLDHTADSDTTLVLKQVCDDIHFRLVQ
ncbi:uncharacterized protein BX664DRAFT_338449 [Halteromyces radiatus]|uniref:uncharacterized protein n=1 Tax=Halteromyces radiatus TaxID=101107 RepID=UPI0022200A47|nr:uncharacterized protein BX664DRAFT_338449 [Halteromyces radiatus]KAI8085065.1 hypothetical protein BX664DRAFT_338449 [Halteromyces radiatus]